MEGEHRRRMTLQTKRLEFHKQLRITSKIPKFSGNCENIAIVLRCLDEDLLITRHGVLVSILLPKTATRPFMPSEQKVLRLCVSKTILNDKKFSSCTRRLVYLSWQFLMLTSMNATSFVFLPDIKATNE